MSMPCEVVALCANETVAKQSRVALQKIEKGRVMRMVNRSSDKTGLRSNSTAPDTPFIIGHATASPEILSPAVSHRSLIVLALHRQKKPLHTRCV